MAKTVSIFLLLVVLSFIFACNNDAAKFSTSFLLLIEDLEAEYPALFVNEPTDVDNLKNVVPFILANDPRDVNNLESVLIPSKESEIVLETDAFVERTITVGEGFQYW